MRKSLKLALVFITILSVLSIGSITPAQAASRTIPSSLRGTWYHYYAGLHKVDKLKITKHAMKFSLKGFTANNQTGSQVMVRKMGNRGYAIGKRDAPLLKIKSHKINGKKHKVLFVELGGAAVNYTRFKPGHHQY
ncbi:hypothetical protein LZY01_00040 [Levilactobacillus zymae]|uniref:Extracellular protein n=1 Tax=Levilactobacillus zymae TaxID=267363 RepID=A0ABQ0WV44_9LACO|nr:hypothetical protein [Levilactobacillus zymae]KRL15705.1 hypothetical protein FD38_GL000710 [Levilactobacillus zymae DSM 19395]QFR60634.1 hypothetical protein LZ395_03430 [Levilactobacillus zymae]GEO70836.1 hypothetical protein LZY01_00040 [Levilactobacillus zymae]